jgi:hypothetical protein
MLPKIDMREAAILSRQSSDGIRGSITSIQGWGENEVLTRNAMVDRTLLEIIVLEEGAK